jgi:hypothetical protein
MVALRSSQKSQELELFSGRIAGVLMKEDAVLIGERLQVSDSGVEAPKERHGLLVNHLGQQISFFINGEMCANG